jgi:hypothetical protein
MSDKEQDKTIVTTSGGGNSIAWMIVGALIVVVGFGAYLFFGGQMPGDDKDIDIKVEMPGSE